MSVPTVTPEPQNLQPDPETDHLGIKELSEDITNLKNQIQSFDSKHRLHAQQIEALYTWSNNIADQLNKRDESRESRLSAFEENTRKLHQRIRKMEHHASPLTSLFVWLTKPIIRRFALLYDLHETISEHQNDAAQAKIEPPVLPS